MINDESRFHISYVGDAYTDTVRYATRAISTDAWACTLSDIEVGGARNGTSIALDPDGQPWIAYTGTRTLRVASQGQYGNQR